MNVLLIIGILVMVPFFFVFPGGTFIFGADSKLPIYRQLIIWKFGIFELWAFGLFYVFFLYRLHRAGRNHSKLLSLGPLKPLVLFTVAGLAVGIIGTIENHGDVSFQQIRYFCEGILLYVVVVNLDLSGMKLKKYAYFIVLLVAANTIYHLLAYILGRGFYWEDLGYMVMAYQDILETYVLTSLFILSALASSVKPIGGKRWLQLLGLMVLSLTTVSIFLSLRRAQIAWYIMGVVTILAFSEIRVKLRAFVACLLLFGFLIGLTSALNKKSLLGTILTRVDSVNVFKYQDDESKDITSSTGHVSEVVNGWNCVKENVFLGIGFGVKIKKTVGWAGEPFMVHNELLFYWIVMGIFGPLVFLSMYWIPLKYCHTRIRDEAYKRYGWFYLWVMSFVTGKLIVCGTFYPPTSLFLTDSFLYFILLGFTMNETLFGISRVQQLRG